MVGVRVRVRITGHGMKVRRRIRVMVSGVRLRGRVSVGVGYMVGLELGFVWGHGSD